MKSRKEIENRKKEIEETILFAKEEKVKIISNSKSEMLNPMIGCGYDILIGSLEGNILTLDWVLNETSN